jgi:molybdate transport system ATP-binding protein
MRGDRSLLVEVRIAGTRGAPARLDVAELEVRPGITVIMGPSGAGKTTLLASVAGLLRPAAGRIVLAGVTLFDAKRDVFVQPHRRRVALVFQSLALFPHMRAWQNVAYGLPPMPAAKRKDAAQRWLTKAHVAQLADRMPATLSGGEAQRVALARALASEPTALLLDEPFSALHASLRRQLGDELRALVDEVALPTLLVTHDPQDAALLGARAFHCEAGTLRPLDLGQASREEFGHGRP